MTNRKVIGQIAGLIRQRINEVQPIIGRPNFENIVATPIQVEEPEQEDFETAIKRLESLCERPSSE